MELNKKIYQSWAIVILALIIFWPVGLFLLYFKIKETSKNKLAFSGKTKIMLGICSLLFALIGTASELENPSEDVITGIVLITFFLSLGAYLVWKGAKNIKEGKIYDRISYLIKYEEIESAEEIARDLKISIEAANTYISKLISMGSFNKEIQYKNGIIIYIDKVKQKEERKKKEHIVKCKCCGGINTIIEDEGSACEYCGMELLISK